MFSLSLGLGGGGLEGVEVEEDWRRWRRTLHYLVYIATVPMDGWQLAMQKNWLKASKVLI